MGVSNLRVAILGINGFLGKPFLEALQDEAFAQNFKYPIIAITRDTSKYTDGEKVVYRQSTSDDELDSILSEVDVLINTAGRSANHTKISELVAKNKLKLFIPAQYGVDHEAHQDYLPIFQQKLEYSQISRDGGVKTIDLITAGFTSAFKAYPEIVGLNRAEKSVLFMGDPNAEINATAISDLAKVVAVIVGVLDYEKLPDKIRIFSHHVTPEQVIQNYEKASGDQIKRTQISKEEALEKAKKLAAEGYKPEHFPIYINAIAAQGPGKGEVFDVDERELVNPGEKYFKWTKQ